MIPEEHRPFIESHKLAVVGFTRKSGPPSLSPVYYYVDGDEIVFSTTKTRGKGRAVARTGELTLCIVDAQPAVPLPDDLSARPPSTKAPRQWTR